MLKWLAVPFSLDRQSRPAFFQRYLDLADTNPVRAPPILRRQQDPVTELAAW